MACVKMEKLCVSGLRSEVNTLWRKVVGETTLCVGGNHNKWSRHTKHHSDQGFTQPCTRVIKATLYNLRDEIKELEGNVADLSQLVAASGYTSTCGQPQCQHIEVVTSQVTRIKCFFKHLQEEGTQVYNNLEREEIELEKDVKALRGVISDELSRSSAQKISRRKFADKRKDCDKNIDMLHKANETSNKTKDCSNQHHQSETCVMPYFRHTWEDKDHIQFVKIYQTHKLKQKCIEEWKRIFPYKTEEVILSHACRYEAFVKKRENVKNKLLEWKGEREKEKKELKEKLSKENEETEKKKMQIRKAKDEKLKRERKVRHRELLEWQKLKKEQGSLNQRVECKEKLVERKNFTKVCRQKARHFTEVERQNIAAQLQAFSEKKLLQKQESIRIKEQEQIKAKLYNRSNRIDFKKRDELYMKNKKEQKELQIKMKEEQMKRLEKIKSSVAVNVSKSRNRLYKSTLSRTMYQLSPQVRESLVVSVNDISQLATPVWRQGLTGAKA